VSQNFKSWRQRVVQVLSLGLVLAVLVAAGRLGAGAETSGGTAAALGLLLLLGVLLSEVLDLLHLPHLTGYLTAGMLAGPHVLGMVDHHTVEELSGVNTLALTLIALAGGLELRLETLKEVWVSLVKANLVHSALGVCAATAAFLVAQPYIPGLSGLAAGPALAVAILWGGLAISRSPSATLAILSQTKAVGPLTRFSLAFVMSSDIVVILLMAAAMMVARPLIDPMASISLESFRILGHEIYGSICVGVTLGVVLSVYLRFVGTYLILVLVLLGFGFSEGVRYIHLDPLLTFLTAGFVVQNLSEGGDKLLHAIEESGAIVFVVFFATAGAHLDLPLLRRMWPVALGLVGTRAAVTVICHAISSRWAGDSAALRRWGWSSMISQAGLTLGLSLMVERAFPAFGAPFRALVIATVAMNEVAGPIFFKMGLDRTGETGPGVRTALG
jgi:Kef-type K+ transport system membrane component KefB